MHALVGELVADAHLTAGFAVVLHGLATVALNGCTGVVLRQAPPAGGRVGVWLEQGGRTVHVQPESVCPNEAAPRPPFLPL